MITYCILSTYSRCLGSESGCDICVLRGGLGTEPQLRHCTGFITGAPTVYTLLTRSGWDPGGVLGSGGSGAHGCPRRRKSRPARLPPRLTHCRKKCLVWKCCPERRAVPKRRGASRKLGAPPLAAPSGVWGGLPTPLQLVGAGRD